MGSSSGLKSTFRQAHSPTLRDAVDICKPTARGDMRRVDRLLREYGDIPLVQVNDQLFADREAVRLHKRAAISTRVREFYGVLIAILWKAHRERLCPTPRIKKPAIPKAEPRFHWYYPDEFDEIINLRDDHLVLLFHLLVGTGAPPGKIFRIRWEEDVDLANRVIHFSADSGQSVAISDDLYTYLEAIPNKEGHVIKPPRGNRYAKKKGSGGQCKTAQNTRFSETKFADFRLTDLQTTCGVWHFAEHRNLEKLKRDTGWRYGKINRVKSVQTADLDRVRQQLLDRRAKAQAKSAVHRQSSVWKGHDIGDAARRRQWPTTGI